MFWASIVQHFFQCFGHPFSNIFQMCLTSNFHNIFPMFRESFLGSAAISLTKRNAEAQRASNTCLFVRFAKLCSHQWWEHPFGPEAAPHVCLLRASDRQTSCYRFRTKRYDLNGFVQNATCLFEVHTPSPKWTSMRPFKKCFKKLCDLANSAKEASRWPQMSHRRQHAFESKNT